jgi:glutamyl-tRNA reductase
VEFAKWPILDQWHTFDWVIIGTKAPYFLIDAKKELPSNPRLIIDLSVPRNVNPELSHQPDTTLLNIDQINSQLSIRNRTMERQLLLAEEKIDEAAMQQMRLFHEKESSRLKIFAEALA